jgi:hypothetical protein
MVVASKIQHFLWKDCLKRLFCTLPYFKTGNIINIKNNNGSLKYNWTSLLCCFKPRFSNKKSNFRSRTFLSRIRVCALLHIFVNSSLIFQDIHLLSSPKDSFDFQLQNPLSQNSSTWSSLQDLSLLLHLLKTEGLFCLCVTDQYFAHKIQTGRQLRLKLLIIIEFVYLHIC